MEKALLKWLIGQKRMRSKPVDTYSFCGCYVDLVRFYVCGFFCLLNIIAYPHKLAFFEECSVSRTAFIA